MQSSTVPEPSVDATVRDLKATASPSPSSSDSDSHVIHQPRPRLTSRKSSSIIIPRDDPNVELHEGDEVFDPDDARAMSPRRTSEDIERLGREARDQLEQHAKALQESLLNILSRIEAVKEEHDKLDNNNKFLQKYIGDLMSTSKITSTAGGGRRK